VVNSKPIFLELSQKYGLPVGEGKCGKVVIPLIIFDDWNFARHTVRGIVDTDGSIFTANKRGSPQYPSIEITTCSIKLARQLKLILENNGFHVANVWCDPPGKLSTLPCYKVPLNGYKNVEKWMSEIGFSNPSKKKKANSILDARKIS